MIKMNDAEIQKNMALCLRYTIKYLESRQFHYVIAAGTLLGAIRHHGFIPWDNDIDIVMPYEDYNRFRQEITLNPIHPDIYVSTFQTEPSHYWPMTKVFLTSTYLVEENVLPEFSSRVSHFSGVYIDIFPAYGVPEQDDLQKTYCRELGDFWKLWRIATKGKDHLLVQSSSMGVDISNVHSPRYYVSKIESHISQYPLKESKFFACTLGAAADQRDVNLSSDLFDTTLVDFEGIACCAPKNYDTMLRRFYGDYMTIPPKEKQIRHTLTAYYR